MVTDLGLADAASSSQKGTKCCKDSTSCCWRRQNSQHDTLSIMSDLYAHPPGSCCKSPPAQLTLKTLIAQVELGDEPTEAPEQGPFTRDFEYADDAISLNEHINVNGKEELPQKCLIETNKTDILIIEKDGDFNGNQKMLRRIKRYGALSGGKLIVPPHRVTPDGTDIYYWCDIPKKIGKV